MTRRFALKTLGHGGSLYLMEMQAARAFPGVSTSLRIIHCGQQEMMCLPWGPDSVSLTTSSEVKEGLVLPGSAYAFCVAGFMDIMGSRQVQG